MSNFKGEIWIEGVEDGSRTDPIIIKVPCNRVRELQNVYAAAPELLEAAKLVIEMADHYSNDYFDAFDSEVLRKLETVIAKAEGKNTK